MEPETIEITEEEKSFVVLACTVFLLSLALLLQSNSANLLRFFLSCQQIFRHPLDSPTRLHASSAECPYKRYLLAETKRRKVELARKVHWLLLMGVNVALLALLFNMMMGKPRWMGHHASWVMLCYQVPILLALSCPSFANIIALDIHYLYLQGLVLFMTFCATSEHNVMATIILGFLCVSIPAAMIAGHLAVVLLGQAALLGIVLYRARTECLADVAQCQNSYFEQRTERTLAFVVFIALVVVAGAFRLVDTVIKYQVALNVRASDIQVQLSAVSSLLDLTCDAVVELDASFRLKSHSNKLAAMLLRTGTTLQGVPFSDLLTAQSANETEERLRTSMPSDGSWQDTSVASAHAFQTQMLDSYGTKVQVEVFSVKYLLTAGQSYHILGLRDVEDQESLALRRRWSVSNSGGSQNEVFPKSTRGNSLVKEDAIYTSDASSSCESQGSALCRWRLKTPPEISKLPLEVQKEGFLALDIDAQVVYAATAPFQDVAGCKLPALFNAESIAFFRRICDEERAWTNATPRSSGSAPNRLVSFSNMPFFLPHQQLSYELNGVMKVSTTQSGALHLIISFRENYLQQAGSQNQNFPHHSSL